MYLEMDVTELRHKTQPGETRSCQNYGGRVGKKKVSVLLFAAFRFKDLLKVGLVLILLCPYRTVLGGKETIRGVVLWCSVGFFSSILPPSLDGWEKCSVVWNLPSGAKVLLGQPSGCVRA